MLDDLRFTRFAYYRDNIFTNVYVGPGMKVQGRRDDGRPQSRSFA